jgi:spore maturation protein CgeB
MNMVVFGLSISSSWGNGHATLWRGLSRGLAAEGHGLTFFERDASYYAEHRDLTSLAPHELVIYADWPGVRARVREALRRADAAIVTSFHADVPAVYGELQRWPDLIRVFYDLDTPVTLARLDAGERVPYLPDNGLRGFDLVLSYTGGPSLQALRARLGARSVAPLYGSVDPDVHRPTPAAEAYRCDLSYLATYASDRQAAVERLLLGAAQRLPGGRFLLGGSQYPASFPWPANLFYVHHVPPAAHAAFYGSSRATLSITRGAMAAMGFCPSGRLFEAAACGVPIVTDAWPGLERFFTPGAEILVAGSAEDVVAALSLPDEELQRIGQAARARALASHTARARARELTALVAAVRDGRAIPEAS